MDASLPRSTEAGLSDRDRLTILIEEYRALYSLLGLRLQVIERRALGCATLLSVLAATIISLPSEMACLALVGLPLSLFLFIRTTIAQVRSKEDVLSRLQNLEEKINSLAGDNLMAFQSRHPSGGQIVGGRSGEASLMAVLLAVYLLLGLCSFLFESFSAGSTERGLYHTYVLAVIIATAFSKGGLTKYPHRRSAKNTHSV